MSRVLVCIALLFLSSNACEARRRHHHHVNGHHRSQHVTSNHSVSIPPRRCVSDDVVVKTDPPQDWSNPKEEVQFTGLTWSDIADQNRMPFTKLVSVKPVETIKQEITESRGIIPSALFFVFSLVALASLAIPNKPESI